MPGASGLHENVDAWMLRRIARENQIPSAFKCGSACKRTPLWG
jgi:hypothetical protein